jgi:hypothetical protein
MIRRIEAEMTIMSLIMLFLTGIVVIGLYWAFLDRHVLTISNRNLSITDSTGVHRSDFRAGEVMLVQREFCANRDMTGRIIRTLINDVVHLLPEGTSHFVDGCQTRRFSITIPAIEPGTYTYRAIIEYQLNPLRSVRVPLPDQEVTIVR